MGFVLIFITIGKDPFIEQQVKGRMHPEQNHLMGENIFIHPIPFLVKNGHIFSLRDLALTLQKLFLLNSFVDIGKLLHEQRDCT